MQFDFNYISCQDQFLYEHKSLDENYQSCNVAFVCVAG